MLEDRSYMRSEYSSRWSVTTVLLVANVACFLLQYYLERHWYRFDELFALSARGLARGHLWQLITFQFLHGGLLHLLGNLLGLYFFGNAIEQMFGSRSMLKLYFLSGTVGGLVQAGLGFVLPQFGASVVGASAGVFGLIAAFATRAPNQIITMLLFFIIPVSFKARSFLYIAIGLGIFGLLFDSGGIAHAAHLGGIAVGVLYAGGFSVPESWKRRAGNPSRWEDSSELNQGWTSRSKEREDLPPKEFISREVDPILEKISSQGIHSLTAREREILEAARNRMAKR